MSRKLHTYQNDHIRVTYDAKRCIHAAECVRRLGQVFDPDKRPWIQPENAAPAEVAETVSHCPTGALHFERLDGGQPEWPDAENTITPAPDGPLYARGQIQVVTPSGEVILEDSRVALCRCGASKDKPLCDGEHVNIDFTDPGDLTRAPRRPQALSEHGPLVVTVAANGPLILRGPFRLVPTSEDQPVELNKGALCRCGHSGNKPFCDGTHGTIGFEGG